MIFSAHVHAEGFGDADGAVGLEIVLKEGDQHTGRSHHGVVQGVGEILLTVVALHANLQTASLRVAQIGAGAYLEILLLTGAPRFHVQTLHLQVGQVAGAAFQRAHRNIQRAEEVHRVLPQAAEPLHALLRLAQHDHFLLFELVNAIYAALLNAVRANLLAEAGRIARQRNGQLALVQDRVNKLADHGVLGGADQIQILTLDLVHHVLHLGEAHHAVHHFAVDHERRHHIGEAAVDHEVAGIAQNGGVQTSHIAHQIIEAVAGGLAGRVQINAVQPLHDVHMIGHLKIRHLRLAEALQLHILAVVLANRHAVVNDVRDDHHALLDLALQLLFLFLQSSQIVRQRGNLRLGGLGLVLLTLGQQTADLLGKRLALIAQRVRLLTGLAVFLVQRHDLVHQHQLLILELLANVLLYLLGVVAEQIDVQHGKILLLLFVRREKEKAPVPAWDDGLALPPGLPCFKKTQPLKRCKGAHPQTHRLPHGGMEPPPRPPSRTCPTALFAPRTDSFPLVAGTYCRAIIQ